MVCGMRAHLVELYAIMIMRFCDFAAATLPMQWSDPYRWAHNKGGFDEGENSTITSTIGHSNQVTC